MQKIYKYFYDADKGEAILPFEAKILKVEKQEGIWFVWALVDERNDNVRRLIPVFGTGYKVPSDIGPHIDTVFDGPFVWHFFDKIGRAHV